MGVEGMEVEPAGQLNYGKGHHHLIIDGGFMEKAARYRSTGNTNTGKGQTETVLDSLAAGRTYPHPQLPMDTPQLWRSAQHNHQGKGEIKKNSK